MRKLLLSLAITAVAAAPSAGALAQEAAPTPVARGTAAVAAPIPVEHTGPIPELADAKALPIDQLLAVARRTLLGQPRRLDYGFELILGPALQGNPAAVQVLAKAIDSNAYGFGSQTDAVLRVLASEAMGGSTSSIIAWALIHDRGIDAPRDQAKAYEWYRWAAVVGSDTGALKTALALAQGSGVAANREEALVWAGRVAAERRGSAYMQLAKIFAAEGTAMHDPQLAERLALESAGLDKTLRVQAAEFLSKRFTNPDTLAQASAMLEAAAADGDLKARFYLAQTGSSDATSDAANEVLYSELAASGDDDAINLLARELNKKGAAPETYRATIELLKQGAANGSLAAIRALSNAYFFGLGTQVSFEAAAVYYHQAADAGDAESQYQLGLMYANALGVPKDLERATFWLRKSADGGYKLATASLSALPKS